MVCLSSRTRPLIVGNCQSRSKYQRTIISLQKSISSLFLVRHDHDFFFFLFYHLKKITTEWLKNFIGSNMIIRIKGRRTEYRSNENKQV